MAEPHTNVDPAELEKFESLAHRWWDKDGEFKPLHDINDVRLKFITDRSEVHERDVIEVGCGGGILTESLASLGARVVGIDPARGPLTVAKIHAIEGGLTEYPSYEIATAETYVDEHAESFHVVAALEMLEHVPDYGITVKALADLAKPGANLFFSTINRHPKAYALMIVAGEYVLNVLPRGTHDYEKFIRPSELAQASRDAGLNVKTIQGYRYNPFTRRCSLCDDLDVNYLLHAEKPLG
ncbi:MAG: bifunctional 2-polyprenyl-6-hydroxyphenol methylase/3-demethylubiquinol 3-O-methyltransferase UbiG [Gammaproteobacteria bacterium]|nr:bifunctional 2-polyprenyl-6-hydroxyphenol methylase/3-demethylubiquinol 3-O-methyltransferase UbiG [Gammaproteobacteria bacterium]